MSELELLLTLAGLVLTAIGYGAAFFGAGFAVGRTRGKTEAYASVAAKGKKPKKHHRDRLAAMESDEQGEVGTTTPPERENGSQA